MGQKLFYFFKSILSRTGILYLLAGFLLIAIGHNDIARIRRTTKIRAWADYPITSRQNGTPATYLELRRALQYYKNFARAYPQWGRGEEMMGYCYFQLKNDALARRYYRIAVEKRPEYFWVYYNLGIVAYVQNDKELAKSCFRKVIEGDAQAQEKAALLNSQRNFPPPFYSMIRFFVEQVRRDSAGLLLILEKEGVGVDRSSLRLQLHPWSYYIRIGEE